MITVYMDNKVIVLKDDSVYAVWQNEPSLKQSWIKKI